jgi:hypothetical protein
MARHRSATLGLCIAAVALACPSPACAAPSVSVAVDANNTIPNVVANSIFTDGNGIDVTAISLFVQLGQGTIYNATTPDNALPQAYIWDVPGFEHLEFDSWLGIPGNGTNAITGGAGDLGTEAIPMVGLTGQGHQTASATWFNTDKTNTGLNRVGNISLTVAGHHLRTPAEHDLPAKPRHRRRTRLGPDARRPQPRRLHRDRRPQRRLKPVEPGRARRLGGRPYRG